MFIRGAECLVYGKFHPRMLLQQGPVKHEEPHKIILFLPWRRKKHALDLAVRRSLQEKRCYKMK